MPKSIVPSANVVDSLNDVVINTGDLKKLLDTSGNILSEMNYSVGEGRNLELDRVDALVRIAHSIAARVDENILQITHEVMRQRIDFGH